MGFRRKLRRFAGLLLRVTLVFALVSVVAVAGLRWLDPPTSSFMVRHWVSGLFAGRPAPRLHHQWTDLDEIARPVPLAVVAAEDQRFPEHSGFDLVELEKAWRSYRSGRRLRGASTLSQQVAKNLFLWSDKSLLRKGLEAWLTVLIEATWSKRRILEVYLNIAQFGPDTFGVGAAARRFFGRSAGELTKDQAALLASVLPNPERYRVERPSSRVRKRAAWIRRQMGQLGPGYLDPL